MPKPLSKHELAQRDLFRRELGERIKRARKEKLTQKQLAEALRVHQGLISRIENGQAGMPVEMLKKMCEILHVSADELMDVDVRKD